MNEENGVLNQQAQPTDENSENGIEYAVDYRACKRPLFDLTKSDMLFAIFSLAVGIFTAVFGIFGGFALGCTLSNVLIFLMFSIYLVKKKSLNIFSVICGVLSLANSAVFITTANGSVRFFGVVLSCLLTVVCLGSVICEKTIGNRAVLSIFAVTLSTVGNIAISVKSLFSNGDGNRKSIGKALVGFICAVPVLLVVIPLLISSDEAFSGMISSIFSNTSSSLFKIIFGVFISLFFISYGFSLKYKRFPNVKKSEFAGIENIYIISFLSAISFCYIFYLFSQLAYFFSAFKGFLPNGEITYAQYARKGFFEMCIIAVINLSMVFLSVLLAKKQNGKMCAGIKLTATFISVFTLIIIATAISKMVLYIDAYGMTVLRVTTSAFMLFLAVVFTATILKIYINKINVVKTALITAGIVVLTLGSVNVNAVCAEYNYECYKNKKLENIDIGALYDLGDEGIPYVVKLACGKDKEIAYTAQTYLAKAYMYDYFDNNGEKFTAEDLKEKQKNTAFSSFSIPKAKAYNQLYGFIEKNPKFCDFCYNYYLTDDIFENDWF